MSSHTETGARPARLPPNPRRHKVPAEQRKRAVRACNACHIRRIKCSGGRPCSRCLGSSRTCEYPPPEKEKTVVQKETYEELQERCMLLERCFADAVPSESNREALVAKWTKPSLPSELPPRNSDNCSSPDEEQETGDGRVLQDPDGDTRYLGESSGAAFVDRLREFVSTILYLLSSQNGPSLENRQGTFTSLLGRYHTHDSRQLLLPHVDPFYLPEPEEVSKLVEVFRFYAEDGAGSSTCGGIYYWGNLQELQDQTRQTSQVAGVDHDSHLLCSLNAVMALACQYDPSLAPPWETHPGETYFARAKFLLINPMEDASAAYIPALCLMGYFLLGLYRRDAAFMYIGLAIRISVIHGLHKGWMIQEGQIGEQRKREFWNTFILDRWLSCLMGRPTAMPKTAITVDLPVDLIGTYLPSATGLRAHAKLALIMDDIVNDVYGTASTGLNYPQSLSHSDSALQKLSSWYTDLPPTLRVEDESEINDRASIVLYMIYNQLIILCTRPLLFQAAKQSVAVKYLPSHQHRQRNPNKAHIEACAKAARSNTRLTRQLLLTNQATVIASLDYHFPFSAGIVLELVALLPDYKAEEDEISIAFLTEYLEKAGGRGNESAADCARMLIELGAVMRRLKSQAPNTNRASSTQSVIWPDVTNALISSPIPYLPNSEGIPNEDLYGDGSQFALGQSAAYDELFSWFISSPN